MDERLAAYVREQWAALVRFAALLCADAADIDTQELVLSTLTRVAGRWRLVPEADKNSPDVYVRRAVVRACVRRGKRAVQRGGNEDFQLMEVGVVRIAVQEEPEPGPTDMVRRALADLPPKQRAALVLRYLDEDASEPRLAILLGSSDGAFRTDLTDGLDGLRGILAVDSMKPASQSASDGLRQTEGLLRAALRDATPTNAGKVPLVALDGRISRSRRRRLVAATAAVVAVAVVATSALTGSHHGTSRAALRAKHRHEQRVAGAASSHLVAAVGAVAYQRRDFDYAGDVTAGGGFLWTIENHPTKQGSRSFVVKRDEHSGHIEARYRVPEADDQIGYGVGRVWTWSDNNDAPRTGLATVDSRGDVTSEESTPATAITGVAFTPGLTWMAEPTLNSVLVIHNGALGATSESRVPGAKLVVPVNAHSVLVDGRDGALSEQPGHLFVDPPDKALTLLAPSPGYGIWVGHNNALVYLPGINSAPTVKLTLPYAVNAVSGDPAHGVYIAMRTTDPLHRDPYLEYYSPASLASAVPSPTAALDGLAAAEGMVADPTGGVVFVTNEGAVAAWDPAVPHTQRP